MYTNAYIRNLERWYQRIIFRAAIEKQTYGHGERGGEGEMCGESNMETYITVSKIDIQREFAVCLRKLRQGLCTNLVGWGGEGDGRGFQKGEDVFTYD